jgi:hypothetical protein
MATRRLSLLCLWRCAALLALAFAACTSSSPPADGPTHLILVRTNDVHGALGSAAR